MNNKKYMIINADDFGVQKSTNSAILELFKDGLITSSSLMTVAPFSSQAAQISKINNLPVGLHLTINSDDNIKRWHSNSNAKSLSDSEGLYHSNIKLALNASSKDVSEELEAQYRFMLNNGCKPDHADNHCGTLYGINGRLFFKNAFRFCNKYDLPFRFPLRPTFLARQFRGKAPLLLVIAHAAIRHVAERYSLCLPDDMLSSPFSIKRIKSYQDLRDYYISEIKNIGSGITEVFLHPSYPINEKPSEGDNEWLKREYELKLLKSGDLLDVAAKQNIQVVSWGDAPFKNRYFRKETK